MKLIPTKLNSKDKITTKKEVQQLHEKGLENRGPHPQWKAWKYYAYEPVIDKRNQRNYKIIIFLDDNAPEFVGFVSLLYPK